MIRDPSDGSVREKPKVDGKPPCVPTSDEKASGANKIMGSTTSGLPPLSQSEGERLRRSRDQLENWRKTGVWK